MPPNEQPRPAPFVQVSNDETHLTLDNKPFYFCGANCYYLMTRAAPTDDQGTPSTTLPDCTQVLTDLQAAGITVIRTWAFNDDSVSANAWNALQLSPGVYSERVFRGLDWVINECGKKGMKLILCLVNYNKDFGGMKQYRRWSLGLGANEDVPCEGFYTDAKCQIWFQQFISAVLTRRNIYTGVEYRNDNTILGWSIANEPRYDLVSSGGSSSVGTTTTTKTILSEWITTTAAFLKRLDPNHLVMVHTEGFYGKPRRQDNPSDYFTTLGCDFEQESASSSVDVLCCHMYPELWIQGATFNAHCDFAKNWIRSHGDVAKQVKKPLLMSEFGYASKKQLVGSIPMAPSPSTITERQRYFELVYAECLQQMKAGDSLAGSLFWTAAAPTYGDYDGFTVYFSSLPSSSLPTASAGVELFLVDATDKVIKQHCRDVTALNTLVASF